jgi:hypothetical protein
MTSCAEKYHDVRRRLSSGEIVDAPRSGLGAYCVAHYEGTFKCRHRRVKFLSPDQMEAALSIPTILNPIPSSIATE